MLQKMFIFMLILGIFHISNAQDNQWGKPNVDPQYNQSAIDFSKISGTNVSTTVRQQQERVVSAEEKQLLAEQRAAKIAGDQQKVLELDKRLDKVRGITISVVPESNGATVIQADRVPFNNGGDVNTTALWGGAAKGFATATEQVGANTGRIWAFVMRDTTASVVDRATLYYTDNGGLTWSAYLFLTLGGTDKFSANTADIEILEGTTGDKYMWVVYGYRVGSTSGPEKFGIMGVNITTFNAGVFGLAWPGNDNAKRYFRPRVASDNPSFTPAGAWVFLVCSFDSLAGSYYDTHQKYAEIHNPTNVTAPTVTYKGPMFSWYMGFATNLYRRDLHTDIAYYRNGGLDSVIVSFSNVPDSTRIFIAAGAEGTYTYNTATRTGTNSNQHQQWTYLFSPSNPSGNNIVMVTRRNFAASGDWDIYNYRSTNGCIPGASWSGSYVDGLSSTTTVPGPAAVNGKRGTLDYRVAYTYDNAFIDSVMYTAFNGATWSTPRRVSYLDSSPFTNAPKAGFRTTGGDDCFILWSTYGNVQVWSSRLCNTTVSVNNNNNSIPHDYSLSQNYPNPFNPVTSINFGIPKSAFVKITIYDITGRIVATPVNSQIEAGYHNISFNASMLASGLYFYKLEAGDFNDTKKMVLIK